MARDEDDRSQYERLRSGLDEMQQRLARMAVTAESANGEVRATVGSRGHLIDLKLDRDIYRRDDVDEIAQLILRTVEKAVAKTTAEVQEMAAEYLPAGQGAGFLRDGSMAGTLGSRDRLPNADRDADGADRPEADR